MMPADVRFGSKADMCAAKSDVRSTPESGHVRCNEGCALCAISGHCSGHRTNAISLGRQAFVKKGSSGL